jgi:hypothetical protein
MISRWASFRSPVPNRNLNTFLAEYLFSRVGNFFVGRRLPTPIAREAFLVVSLAQSGDHLPLDVILTGRTFRTKIALIIGRTIISTVFGEESTLGQGVATHLTFETLRVEVFVLDTEHLAGTFFLT